MGGYLRFVGHQESSSSLVGQYQPVPFVLAFMAPCVGHCGTVSAWGLGPGQSGTVPAVAPAARPAALRPYL